VQVLGFIDLPSTSVRSVPQQLNNSTPQVLCNKQDSDSLAGYVDMTWEVTDQFSLSGGYRHHARRAFLDGPHAGRVRHPRRQPEQRQPVVAGFQRPDAGRQLQSTRAASSSTRTRPASATCPRPGQSRAGAWSAPTSSQTLFGYATISEGYKAGGYNDQTGTSGLMVSALTRPSIPEFATNYEIGMKWESDDNRFRFNPTVFYTKYKDAQRAVNIITEQNGRRQFQETVFYNAAEVEAKGIELEFQAQLTDASVSARRLRTWMRPTTSSSSSQPGLTDPASGARSCRSSATSPGCRCRARLSTWADRSRASTPWTWRRAVASRFGA
jgi:iron complex outermembrane recepter protein